VWQSQEFTQLLEARGIDGLVIGGVELCCCVLYAVLGAEERGFRYVAPQDLISGQDPAMAATTGPSATTCTTPTTPQGPQTPCWSSGGSEPHGSCQRGTWAPTTGLTVRLTC
jgi:hypothetical protein